MNAAVTTEAPHNLPWVPGDPAPEATREHERALADLCEHGYCIIADALSAEQLEATRERFVNQAQAEIEAGVAFEDSGPEQKLVDSGNGRVPVGGAFTAANGGVNQRLWMLVNKGQVFRDLVLHPVITALVTELLGKHFLLSTLSGNIARPGGVEMALHTDQWWLPRPLPRQQVPVAPANMKRREFHGYDDGDLDRAISPAVACNAIFFLNDFTEANGGTRLVPKSHLTGMQAAA